MKFDDMGLHPNLLKAIHALGFVEPTPIQKAAIPKIMDGQSDMVGLAQTGTGKTAAFGLPMLHLMDRLASVPQGLVICPTRELCLQITADLAQYARYLDNVQITAVYGGAAISDQIRKIKRGTQIIVATPGRLLDLMNRSAVNISQVRFVVLDEADEMFSMGFQEDINDILKRTPESKRTWLFSATMPSSAARIAKTYMRDPVEVTVGRRNIGAANIDHTYFVIKEKDRYAALKRLIDFEPDIYGLIFCRTRAETATVAANLAGDGYQAEALHGDLSQEQRNQVMRKFRERALQLLVATDVAARGIDVEDISHVIHYNLPDEDERYTHRSGRTARAGKSGISLMLVNSREARRLPELQRRAGIRFNTGAIPRGSEICEKQLFALVHKMAAVDVNHKDIAPYLPPVYKALEGLSREELIQRFVSAQFNRFLNYYRGAGDLDSFSARSVKPQKSSKRPPAQEVQRFLINIGRLHKINEGAIVRWVCEKTGIRSNKIGQIDLSGEFSFFEVDISVAQKVFKIPKNAKLDDRTIHIQAAETAKTGAAKNHRSAKRSANPFAAPVSKKHSPRPNR
ncbi:MAG: DEAD/DEAH box helicase [Desulfobacteraceae bacterium]|nr:MAG: DEAD/DEAH box helicase [Desulfobacteraceae bacterium]